MKIFAIAIALLIFSSIVSLYNELGIFDQKQYDPGFTVNQEDVSNIYQVESGGDIKSSSSWIDDITGGVGFLIKIRGMVWKTLGITFNLGGVFGQYVPGAVGVQVGILINVLTYFVYAWGGIQLWQKVSTKNMD